VGEEGEYTLGENLTERKGTFGGRNSRSSEVAVAMKREVGEEIKKERRRRKKKGFDRTVML
jgi:hypothetical protein